MYRTLTVARAVLGFHQFPEDLASIIILYRSFKIAM